MIIAKTTNLNESNHYHTQDGPKNLPERKKSPEIVIYLNSDEKKPDLPPYRGETYSPNQQGSSGTGGGDSGIGDYENRSLDDTDRYSPNNGYGPGSSTTSTNDHAKTIDPPRMQTPDRRAVTDIVYQHMKMNHEIDSYIQEYATERGIDPSRVQVVITEAVCDHPLKNVPTEVIYTELQKELVEKAAFRDMLDGKGKENRLAAMNNWLDPDHNENSDGINFDFENPIQSADSYLDRSAAYFKQGDYDKAINDYNQYDFLTSSEIKIETSDDIVSELLRGIGESAKGLGLFVSELVTHPIHTTTQVYSAFKELTHLIVSNKWNKVGDALAPELRSLVQNWDQLTEKQKIAQSMFIFGKYGADILIPGAAIKLISNSTKAASRFFQVSQKLLKAENTLVLESASTLKTGAKVKEAITSNKKIISAGRELNYSARDLLNLKQAGKLKGDLDKVYKGMFKSVAARESFELLEKAQEYLKPYKNQYMPEAEVRRLIENTGVKTYPRPKGIPENFRIKVTNDGVGIMYVHPEHNHTSIRVMPGKPYSPNPVQQKPYVIQKVNGKAYDSLGNIVAEKAPEAHIPLESFVMGGLNVIN